MDAELESAKQNLLRPVAVDVKDIFMPPCASCMESI